MKKLCIITTRASSIDNWIKPFLPLYHKENVAVTVVAGMTEDDKAALLADYPYVTAYNVDMPRGADLLGTLRSIPALYRIFKRGKFDMLQYSTPNASFYSAIAGRLARVPVRLYCQWGMVFAAQTGVKRAIFKTIEKITCRLSTHVQPDSFGNLKFCRARGFYNEKKSAVIWNGSAKGVDLKKFDITKKEQWRREIRVQYGIADSDRVLGFVGRLGRDKGCNELFAAFRALAKDDPSLKLLFVGPIEKEDTIEDIDYFRAENRIIKTGRVGDVQRYLAAMDLFILPSYREGFGMSVVEAEAMGVPVIVTDIPGPTDGMLRDKTGKVIPVRDSGAIIESVTALLADSAQLRQMSAAGARFAADNFDSKIFAQKLLDNRKQLLGMEANAAQRAMRVAP
ncbi:MAG: glycosyltransferase [Clostridia bacterium]|nr:glycosyltransferase [Clostridia bacterium]